MPLVSVVIPCYNARRWIDESIRSVLRQGVPDVEIVVVDDGSTDGTAKLVRRDFPGARVVEIDHGGPGRARNVGTRLTSGEFLQYLDADDVLADGKLVAQVEALRRSDGDVAYGPWRELVEMDDGSFRLGRLYDREIIGNPEIVLFHQLGSPPAVYLFRRRIAEAVAGWREDLRNFEDARFALDCALAGGRFVFCSALMAYYRVRLEGSTATRDPARLIRDCFLNATQVEEWWRAHGGLDRERCKALVNVYGYVARASYEKDPQTHDEACKALERLEPGWIPPAPWRLTVVSRLIGYRRAEWLAARWRRARGAVRRPDLFAPRRRIRRGAS